MWTFLGLVFCLFYFFNNLKRISLATQIFIALFLGVLLGVVCSFSSTSTAFISGYLKPIGTVFINLLKMIVIPVVFLSIIDGVVSMGDVKKLGSVGLKSVLFFVLTTVLACILGLSLSSAFKGAGLFPKLDNIVSDVRFKDGGSASFVDVILGLFTGADMLTVIIVAVMVGIAIINCGEKAKAAAETLGSFYSVCERVTNGIIKVSPIGVFAMTSWVVATQGIKIISKYLYILLKVH